MSPCMGREQTTWSCAEVDDILGRSVVIAGKWTASVVCVEKLGITMQKHGGLLCVVARGEETWGVGSLLGGLLCVSNEPRWAWKISMVGLAPWPAWALIGLCKGLQKKSENGLKNRP